ncbi:MAG: hypothetical protein NTW96_18660 [Planctomycetia bacterium]|nr:hypothetical protein [Planctomycetia bacterium]
MTETDFRDSIDDYVTSIHAILGFANFYLWDPETRTDVPDVLVFQGRHLCPLSAATENEVRNDGSYVTPDLGVLLPDHTGVLAEVKLSFPKDQAHWMDDFKQLMSYDADLDGWPSEDGRVIRHEVVLITEQGRAVRVRKFYENHAGNEIKFERPFVIVAVNRSDNRQPYYFFQRTLGNLTRTVLDSRLEEGVKVPMTVLLEKYSTVKLYDAEPPLPYMMDLIWTHVVVDAARQEPKFSRLHKRHKLPVVLQVESIVERLREEFSCRSISAHASCGTPSVPKKTWIVNALEQFVSMKEAEWIDAKKEGIRVFFQRIEDSLDHFIASSCRSPDDEKGPPDQQPLLQFPDDPDGI